MKSPASAFNKFLIAGAAAGALALSASPAFADFYELNYSTSMGTGTIIFLVGTVGGGQKTGPITSLSGTETITNSNISDSGQLQTVTLAAQNVIAPPHGSNPSNLANNNQLLSAIPAATSPSSPNGWFSNGGLAFVDSKGVNIDLYTDGAGNLREYAEDNLHGGGSGNSTTTAFSGTLIDLGAPGPTPGTGVLSLAFLAAAGVLVKARERFAS